MNIRQVLTAKQITFLKKVYELTKYNDIHITTSLNQSGYIACIANRILDNGYYDSTDSRDMDLLTLIRNWYIKNHTK